MPNKFLMHALGRTDPDAIKRVRRASLKLRLRVLEREMQRHQKRGEELAGRYIITMRELEAMSDAKE